MSISTDQLTALKAKVDKIVADKIVNDADWTAAATASATLDRVKADAATAVSAATADKAARDATAAGSDAVMTTNVTDLQVFINTLNTTP